MKIHTQAQGSLSWLELRAGKVTASEIGELITPQGKPRTGERPQKYLHLKLAEHMLGGPLPSIGGSFAMEQGSIREQDAIPWFEMETGLEVCKVGFIETDDGRAGCSPDGLIGDAIGIEVKCPQANTHVKYLLDWDLPDQYVMQVQFSMLVTGRKEWKFLSYCPGFKPLLLSVAYSTTAAQAIHDTLTAFYAEFDAAYEKLK